MAEKAEKISEEDTQKVSELAMKASFTDEEVLNGTVRGENEVPGIYQIVEADGVSIKDAVKLWAMRNKWRFTEKVNALCVGTFIPSENDEPIEYESQIDGTFQPIKICNFLIDTEGGLIVGATDWGCKTSIESGKCYEIECREGRIFRGVRQINMARDSEGNYKYKEIEKINFGELNPVSISDLQEYDGKFAVLEELTDMSSIGDTKDGRKVFKIGDADIQISVFAEPSLIEGIETGVVRLCGRVSASEDGNITINAGAIL